jgi:peptidoglycan/LPS O-acetylase OafA/YrhL
VIQARGGRGRSASTLDGEPHSLPRFDEALSSRRRNSFGFLRWVLAALVVVDHSFPISGLDGGADPLWKWSRSQDSLGGLAVAGFFMISGFLVCNSYFASSSSGRYLWKRFLRIFPGYWVCLAVTAFVFAPLAWIHERGSLDSSFFDGTTSPLHYVSANFFLHIHQWDVDGLLNHTPYSHSGYPVAWDGSLWTLIYEFKCYLLLGLLGFLGLLKYRRIVLALTAGFYFLMISWQADPTWAPKLLPVLSDVFVARYAFLFMFGATLALYADRILLNDRLGIAAGLLVLITLHYGGWLLVGYAAFGYCLFWLASRLPMQWWDRFGDLSYGTYIYAFPIQMTLADHGLQRHGLPAFVTISLLGATVPALLSWNLVEKRALRLKGAHLPIFGAARTTKLDARLPVHGNATPEDVRTRTGAPDLYEARHES